MVEPILKVTFRVIAYDCSGYGENCSEDFTNGEEAVKYAKALERRFGAKIFKRITMEPINVEIVFEK